MTDKKNNQNQLAHLDAKGRARMVDISAKQPTMRLALARGWVQMSEASLHLIEEKGIKKGDVLAEFYTNNKNSIQNAEKTALNALTIDNKKPVEMSPLILACVDKNGFHYI